MTLSLVDKVVTLHDTLTKADLSHAFGGALALAYHAEPRGTREIDLNVFVPLTDRSDVLAVLAPLGIQAPSEEALQNPIPTAGLRCPWDATHVDVFLSYDDEWFASVRSRSEDHYFIDSSDGGHVLPFLSAEDLVVFKITFGRPKDWVDIAAILAQQPVDPTYVQRWLLHLRGATMWPAIRRFISLCDDAASG